MPKIKSQKHAKEEEYESRKETERKKLENRNSLEKEKEKLEKEKQKENDKKEKVNGKKITMENEAPITPRRRTRGQIGKNVRVECSRVLKMTEKLVLSKGSKQLATKVQCEDDLFGYESFTYITWEDFQVIFTLDELTGSIITCYMM